MNHAGDAAARSATGTGIDSRMLARRAGIVLALVLTAFVVLTWDHHGISNDEEVQHVYGRLLLDFYASGLSDRAAFEYRNLYLYGGLFDLVAAALERLLPINVWDLRHLLSALFGLAGILAAWKLARTLAGDAAGLAAALMLALAGAWSGAMFTHTKDVPFAATMAWALYYTTVLTAELPAIRRTTALKLGVALGCAFGLRIGAVFAVFGLVATLAVAAVGAGGGWRAAARRFAGWCAGLMPAAAVALALMALFWPWSVMAPDHLLEAATRFSHFAFELDTIFDGTVMRNGAVPRGYLHAYLLVKLPELMLIGLALALGGRPWRTPEACPDAERRAAARGLWPVHLPLVLAIAVPLAYAWLGQPALYNGIRHFLFLLPPLAVAAALGWRMLWQAVRGWSPARWGLGLAFAVLAVSHGVTLSRLHPYGYTYYNRLAGGLEGAAQHWELDYWSATAREAAEFLDAYVAREEAGRDPATLPPPWPVAVCAESVQAGAWLSPRLRVTRDWRAAEFFIATTHMGCDRALKGSPLLVIERNGVPLGVLLDRRRLTGAERDPR